MKTETRMYSLGKRADDQAQTRRRILDAARALLLDSKGTDIGLEDVAMRARVTRLTIYRHFGSRTALIRALVADVSDRVGLPPAIQKALDEADTRKSVRAFVRAATGLWEKEERMIKGVMRLADDPAVASVVKEADASRYRDAMKIAKKGAAALTLLTHPQSFYFLVDRLDMKPEQARALLQRMAVATIEGE